MNPPTNLEAERATLGGVLIDPSRWPLVAAALERDDFYLPAHRDVYEAMGALAAHHDPIDVVLLGNELKARAALPQMEGGESYLLTLASAIPTGENLEHYIRAVKEASLRRRYLMLLAESQSRAGGEERTGELIENLTGDLARLVMRAPSRLQRIGTMIPQLQDEIERRVREGVQKAIRGVRTGIQAVDRMTLGFHAGEVVVVAADPGGGKTALALQTALTTVLEDGGAALVFSLEMPRIQLLERAIVRRARVNSQRLRLGQLEGDMIHRIRAAESELYEADLTVEDRAYGMGEMLVRTHEWAAQAPVTKKRLVVVDYLQLIASEQTRDTRARELGKWCTTWKTTAQMLDLVVLLVSQLNRSGTKNDRPPNKHDLRDSGEIEQAAHTILLLWNPDGTSDGEVKGILDKQRNGPTGLARIHWCGRYYEHSDVEGVRESDPQLFEDDRRFRS